MRTNIRGITSNFMAEWSADGGKPALGDRWEAGGRPVADR
jgi:hypothetical protein